MGTPTEALAEAQNLLLSALADSDARLFHDDALLDFTAAAESVGRLADALRIKAAGEHAFRSRRELGEDRLSAKRGCRNAVELLARITLASERTLTQRMRLGEATRPRMALSGEAMPARFDQVADALSSGAIGYDSAAAIVDTLDPIRGRVGDLNVEHAETALVAAATGPTVESPVPFAADEIRGQARVWATVLDEDGVVPAEERAMQARGISAGVTRDGVVHRKMTLLPEIDAKFETLLNAYLNPRSKPSFADPDPDAPKDPRASAQARHDVFASLIDGAARSADSPSIGGAAPTVLVSVRQADLDAGTGSGFIEGCEAPISMRAVEQFICAGGQQHVVIGPDGTINSIGSNDRVFNATQRRAITLRDGGCIIPGCSIPAAWSEIHHVKAYRDGGETETCNGVLLCWFHHRTIETSGWQILMIDGVPHVKPPPWLRGGRSDADTPWRRSTKSRTQQADLLQEQQQKLPTLVD
ncbi:HNH endonuclease signature motif containing protein [Microterricola gilva]|nr:HNH endonuclease signature motif containing protein [Microterricola gilva]